MSDFITSRVIEIWMMNDLSLLSTESVFIGRIQIVVVFQMTDYWAWSIDQWNFTGDLCVVTSYCQPSSLTVELETTAAAFITVYSAGRIE